MKNYWSTTFKIFILTAALNCFFYEAFTQHQNFIEISAGINYRSNALLEFPNYNANSPYHSNEVLPSGRVWNAFYKGKGKYTTGNFFYFGLQKITKKKLVLEINTQYLDFQQISEFKYFDSEGNPKEGIPLDFVLNWDRKYKRVDTALKFGYSFFERFSLTPKIGMLVSYHHDIISMGNKWSTTHDLYSSSSVPDSYGNTDQPSQWSGFAFEETEFEFFSDGTFTTSSSNPENRTDFSFLAELEMSYDISPRLSVTCSQGMMRKFKKSEREERNPQFKHEYRFTSRIGLKYNLGSRITAKSEED